MTMSLHEPLKALRNTTLPLQERGNALRYVLDNVYSSYFNVREHDLYYFYIDIKQSEPQTLDTPAAELTQALAELTQYYLKESSKLRTANMSDDTEEEKQLYLNVYRKFITLIVHGSDLSEHDNSEALATFLALQDIAPQKLIPIPLSPTSTHP